MNLRELTEDQNAILAQVENGDFTLDQVSDHLELLESERKEKIENYLHVINTIQARITSKVAEVERIEQLLITDRNALSNLKEWLLFSMKDGEKYEFDLFKVSRVKGREVVNVLDSKQIPMSCMSHKPESWSVDKRALLSELKNGAEIKGAELVTGKPSLRIK